MSDEKNDPNILVGPELTVDFPLKSLGDVVLETLEHRPSFVSQVDYATNKETTYKEMREKSVRCALWMKRNGISEGDVVALSVPNCLDSYVPVFASFYIGAVFNPWDHTASLKSTEHFMSVTKPKIVFASSKAAEVISQAAVNSKATVKIVTFEKSNKFVSLEDALKVPSDAEVRKFTCTDSKDISKGAIVFFSSGTTGLPKGVELSHNSILSNLSIIFKFGQPNQTALWYSTLYWISGIMLVLRCVLTYSKRVLCQEFDPKILGQIIEDHKVEFVFLSPSAIQAVLKMESLKNRKIDSLKQIMTGGAILKGSAQEALERQIPNCDLFQAYGMTEVGGVCTAQRKGHKPGSCGKVTFNAKLKMIDINSGKTLGPNQEGEMCVKTDTLMNGYYNNAKATRETIDSEKWLHTGDLAYYDDDGEVFIVDRLKELIKYKGYQVSPSVIEGTLCKHKGVLEVAVVAVPNDLDDEHPIAFVSKVPGANVTKEELINIVKKECGEAEQLRAGVEFLDKLPQTPSGKVARKELKALARKLRGIEI